LLDNPKEVAAIRRKTPRFHYDAIMQKLYYWLYDGILLRCLSHKGALKEAHDGICGAH